MGNLVQKLHFHSKNSTKCDVCAPLKGMCLYAKEVPHLENMVVDKEIKELWNEIESVPMEDILQEYDIALRNDPSESLKSQNRKRKKPQKKRMGKIVNTHIYSTEEFKTELEHQDKE
eukprot:GHVP01053986.1.p2 GENE.GHVP01053986.1~~GHVP01053986.1.p2  ORF type:complete len:117 (-),score=31.39 GHVP01053986.1:25-375(-)